MIKRMKRKPTLLPQENENEDPFIEVVGDALFNATEAGRRQEQRPSRNLIDFRRSFGQYQRYGHRP